ncbi:MULTISPECIES: nucleotide pyrophosphohydrolase [Bacteroidota]|jgi:hypothetical protein|uniref:Nucleotide pyrophosphohydrolase n=1 Tax=Sphingobacterium hotanense TaxID=649196 RepID=A0ABT7NLS3_9SPHI|nr:MULTISPECIES: nucleotide pyrophosphohydrolase [Bacteroidota]MDM1048206.1 nucleotide pyrophosphohydrolase [Sphingobacterium hotanense]
MIKQIKKKFFDDNYISGEQIPRYFNVSFKEVGNDQKNEVRVIFNGTEQLGDVINDNSYKNDYYRYHDIFHYSFAALLGWSPCTRAMMKRKRKSNTLVDEIEDGARATITEEAISMIIFNEAKRKNFFKGKSKVSKTTLRIIKEMTENFEVSVRTSEEWEYAILQSYAAFRFLISNQGGLIEFDTANRKLKHISF